MTDVTFNDFLYAFDPTTGEEIFCAVNPDEFQCDFVFESYESVLFVPAGTPLDVLESMKASYLPALHDAHVTARRQRRIRHLSVNPESPTPVVFCLGDSHVFWTHPNGLGLYTLSGCVLQQDEFSVRRYLTEPEPSVRRIREYVRYRLPSILQNIR